MKTVIQAQGFNFGFQVCIYILYVCKYVHMYVSLSTNFVVLVTVILIVGQLPRNLKKNMKGLKQDIYLIHTGILNY